MLNPKSNQLVKSVDENVLACERILGRQLTPGENLQILQMVLNLHKNFIDKP